MCKFVETWSVQGVPLGMYAPAFLSLNKKQAKSCDTHKPKRLGSPKRRNLSLENRLNPEALKLCMVPNITTLRSFWCKRRPKRTIFDIQKLAKTVNFAMYLQNQEVSVIPAVQKEAVLC